MAPLADKVGTPAHTASSVAVNQARHMVTNTLPEEKIDMPITYLNAKSAGIRREISMSSIFVEHDQHGQSVFANKSYFLIHPLLQTVQLVAHFPVSN